jgi:hypothetical protein
MNKHPLDDRPSSNRFAALILISVAIPCALILYSHFFSKPTSTRIDQSRQEAGETSIANNEMFSNGGILQRDLIGNEKPQEYLHLQTGSKGHTFVPSEITVRAGEIVSVTLKNQNKRSPSENWVLLNPGTTQEVKEATRNEPIQMYSPLFPLRNLEKRSLESFGPLNNREITRISVLLRTSAPKPMESCTS